MGACSAKEFSRPPAQLAGSLLFPGRARKRLRALPTLYIRCLDLFHSAVGALVRLQYILPTLAIAE